jgi:hypothetical protein
MTDFIHWRKATWALLLWSGYIATWAVITGSDFTMVIVWWLAGLVVFRPLWVLTQPLLRQGRGPGGPVRQGGTPWRVVSPHRTNPGTGARRDAG